MTRVCFDHLSGTPLEPAVFEAMRPWLVERWAGASALHSGGVAARKELERAREQVAAFLKAGSGEEIIFTSSGTEATNLAVKGCALANQRRGKHIVLSAMEHPAVVESIEFLKGLGFTATVVGASPEGWVDPAAIGEATREDTVLICAHAGNHDVGTVQNIRGIGEVAAERGIAFFVDATYAAGWLEIDAAATQTSYIAIAPHRFGGPKGAAALYKNRRARLTPLIHGGSQEHGWRGGTENLAGIVGAAMACEIAARDFGSRVREVSDLQSRTWRGLRAKLSGIRINGPEPGPRRLPNMLSVSIAGIEGEGLALSLDMKGFEISAGAACVTKSSRIPATLAAMGIETGYAQGAIIMSFGAENTQAEVDQFLEILPGAVERLREMSPGFS